MNAENQNLYVIKDEKYLIVCDIYKGLIMC